MSGAARVAGWWALLAVLAWLCIASLVERLAGQGVFVASATLPPGGNIDRVRAEAAWRAGDLPAAVRWSRAAVVRQPVDAGALRLAGAIAVAAGDATRGDALMRLAGAAGWRDRETQIYWAEASIAQRDWPVAVERVEALARQGLADDVRRLSRPIEAASPGRAALVARWRDGGDWLPAALIAWPTDDPAAMRDRLALVTAMRGALSTGQRDAIAAALVPDRIDWAFAIVRPDERRLAFPPGGEPTPLGWALSAAAGIDATVSGDGERLRVRASGPALLPLAERLLRLPPGTTRLVVPVDGARTDLPLIATLDCVTGQGASATPAGVAPGRLFVDLRVPPGCAAQRLTLAVAGEEARRGADLTLHPPTLSRAAAAP